MAGILTHPKVAHWLREHPKARIGVACSGGCDSVALLAWWAQVYPERLACTVVLHFNHQLRGEASDGDALFVRELCERLNIAFHSTKWERPSSEEKHVSEESARKARHAFFAEAAQSFHLEAILLAHHKEDVLETMLMGLARGQGSRGLSSPRPLQAMDGAAYVLMRPLLHAAKADLKAYLSERKLSWREDASNFTDTYTRNRLRRQVIPLLLECIPQSIVDGASHSRERLEEDDETLTILANNYLPLPEHPLDWGTLLATTHAAIRRRILYHWLDANGLLPHLSRSAIEKLWEAAESGQSLSLSAGNKHVHTANGSICCLDTPPPEEAMPASILPVPGSLTWGNYGSLAAEWAAPAHPPSSKAFRQHTDPHTVAWLCAKALGEKSSLRVRPWAEGYTFQPLGFAAPSKLSDLFINRKIPRDLRKKLPLIVNYADQILWVPGFGPCELYKIFDATTAALRLTWHPNLAVFSGNSANTGTSGGKTLT